MLKEAATKEDLDDIYRELKAIRNEEQGHLLRCFPEIEVYRGLVVIPVRKARSKVFLSMEKAGEVNEG